MAVSKGDDYDYLVKGSNVMVHLLCLIYIILYIKFDSNSI